VITSNRKTVAMPPVPFDADDPERLMVARSSRFRAMLYRSRGSIKEAEGL
jgi:hypothetical protein